MEDGGDALTRLMARMSLCAENTCGSGDETDKETLSRGGEVHKNAHRRDRMSVRDLYDGM